MDSHSSLPFFSQAFAEKDENIKKEKANLFSLLFAIIGVVSFIALFLQVW